MDISQYIKDTINAHSKKVFECYGLKDVQRSKKDTSILALCPFHDDKKPSFTARLRGGAWQWKCQSCGATGSDIFSFVADMEKMDRRRDFNKVARIAANICGIVLDDEDTNPTPKPTAPRPKAEPTPTTPPEAPRYFNAEVKRMEQELEQTNLFIYLSQIWEAKEVKRVMGDYRAGRGYYISAPHSRFNPTDDYVISKQPRRLQNSINCNSFPSIDTAGNCHAVKVIPYPTTDHHRIKDAQPDRAPMDWIKPPQNPGAYFGTHLLPLRPTAPVAIVESEKSAIIGALFEPRFIWIATQTKSDFKQCRKMEALAERELHIFPDTDGLEEWRATTEELRAAGYNIKFRDEVIKLFPADSKLDVADLIIWEMERRAGNE